MSPRRRARAVALQVLYAMDSMDDVDPDGALATHLREFGVSQDEDVGEQPDESRGEPAGSASAARGAPSREGLARPSEASGEEAAGGGRRAERTLPGFPSQRPFDEKLAATLVRGVWAHRVGLDEMLTRLSQNWRVERLARVDRNVLRIALFELAHCQADVPARVAINEAVELAKRYGSEEAPAFVNGLLDSALDLLGVTP
jgi:N utilization substance protein B